MGQYYLIVNPDKKQFLDPHKFGSGLKLMEFGCDSCGPLLGLAVLLADGNNRGGGDLRTDDPLVGSWAGDRIVIAGDYADPGKFLGKTSRATLRKIAREHFSAGHQDPGEVALYHLARYAFEGISDAVIRVVAAAEGADHPWSAMELAGDGWRQRGDWGMATAAPVDLLVDMVLDGRLDDAAEHVAYRDPTFVAAFLRELAARRPS